MQLLLTCEMTWRTMARVRVDDDDDDDDENDDDDDNVNTIQYS